MCREKERKKEKGRKKEGVRDREGRKEEERIQVYRDSPHGPMVKTAHPVQGHRFDPWSENNIPHVTTIKTWCSQINK